MLKYVATEQLTAVVDVIFAPHDNLENNSGDHKCCVVSSVTTI